MAPMASTMTLKRIHREIADVAKEDLGPITLHPTSDNLFLWKGSIPGPQGSPYEGGVFAVDVVLANDYPFSAPKVTFTTRIYHMNISDRGNICIDILKNNWSPALSLFKVMLSLSSLLTDPNPHDPLVPTIATEFVRNRAQHDKTARQWTDLYATPKPAPASAASSSSSSAPTTTNRGKAKASPSSSITNSTRHRPPAEPITIDDSDDDLSRSVSPRPNGKGKKRKRDLDWDEVVDLTDDGGGGRKNKRRASAGGSGQGDVIIIDD